MSALDPIAAIATAPGRGGIGVVRVSGRDVAPLVQAILGRDALTPRHAHFLPFLDADGLPIDEGIALYFPAPHSYTGETVLELQGHGGPVVLRRLLSRCLEAGAGMGLRLAEPGEFTQRAFLNERLDLAQAEAVADLIDAASEAAARGAAASLRGAFSQAVSGLADRIVHLRMLVEATLDFPEEEIDFLEKYQARPTLDGIRAELARLTSQARQGALLREGLHVVLAGVPNVGKSSLLNALAGFDAAIVTPVAGTTRDKVVQELAIEGVPLHVVDTAGLRETDDEVERIGIARTWEEIGRADAVIHLRDARAPQDDQSLGGELASRLPRGVPVLEVFNKIDLAEANASLPDDALRISARTGAGLDTLRAELLRIAGWQPAAETPYLARERHLTALAAADAHLEMAALHAEQDDRVLDLFAEELRLAHDRLGEITGAFGSDDLLGVIFSRFCIGK
ncbi:tRNA uridine-5-carboxymethylaminomethyl(34) synthesis GTPase MnmE [Achromobacter sp. GG226]|uniref:tRNA uridine-5-carboxymethylaminomethyl(34) synthesis GTPase MnmE n=1 Tax=Verticiella alkaliphila TaxID=2779529 RepID=UPI001C0D6DC0|nr:tRNA uridine-5-carboxymethylaminomethyl(34) synthesis GTPase MnmE [Verticiella sp. GG226]MBU4609364.1 tRNA uridine-5-carboxymethylaminomethyl(34) synthesis GTPase MnmE [Verticiella sp. GG226]